MGSISRWPQGESAENLPQWPPCTPGEHQQNASSPEIVPPLAVAKIHCPEIPTSPDRNLASHILLALPGRFKRFRKQAVWRPCLKLLRCKPLSGRARNTQSQINIST